MAEVLRNKHYQDKKDKNLRTRQAQVQRKQELDEQEEQNRQDQDKKIQNKINLKRVFDENAEQARKHTNARNTQIKDLPDYQDHNVFTYIHEPKIHKSLAMGKKNEEMVNLMKDQFMH